MRAYYWVMIFSLWILALAACTGEENEAAGPATPAEATAAATEEGTPEVDPYPIGPQQEPGLRAIEGLSLLSSQVYTNTETGLGYVVLEVENTTGAVVGNINLALSLLDSTNAERATLQTASPLLNIPAGFRLPIALSFTLPPDYSGVAGVVSVEEEAALGLSLSGEYDLPVQLEVPDSLASPLTITGSLSNSLGLPLVSPMVLVAVYDAEGGIVGAGLASPEGLTSTGEWAPDSDLSFTLTLNTLAGPAAEVRATAVAYRLP
jgi:hypothetical protein